MADAERATPLYYIPDIRRFYAPDMREGPAAIDWYFDEELTRLRRQMVDACKAWESVRPFGSMNEPIGRRNMTDEQTRAMHEAMESERAYFARLKELADP